MKKTAALLLLSFILMLFAGCGGQEKTETPVGTGDTTESNNDKFEDLEYYECTILQDRDVTVPFWYEADTALADEALQKIANVSDTLGCSITLKMTCDSEGVNDNADAIIRTQATGESAGDIFFGDSYVNYLLASSDNLYPLTEVKDYLDYENAVKFGAANVQELTLINGVPYAVTPVQWPEMLPNMRDVFIVNTDLSGTLFNQPDPREFVETKTWNRDSFESFIADTTQTEDGTTSIYGLAGSRQYLIELAILNNDVAYLSRTDDGTYVSELDSEKALDALTWVTRIVTENPNSFLLYNDSPRTVTDTFIAGDSTSLLMSTWWLFLYIVYDVDNFAVMPFPSMCDKPESGWVTAYQSNLMSCIPLNADEPDYSALVIDKLFEPFDNYPDNQSIKDYYAEQVFHDSRDVDVLFKLADYSSYCYNYVGGEDFVYNISNNFTTKTPAEHLSSVVSSLQDVIDNYIEPNYSYMESH